MMEVGTLAARSTGAPTMAELVLRAAAAHGGPAQRYKNKRGDGWVEVSYAELGIVAREIAKGLIGLGIETGDKVAILSDTRPEWTWCDFGALCAGATVVPVYQTNSPEECQYVLSHSEARAVFCEDRTQLDKIEQVRAELPALEHVIAIEGEGAGSIPLRDLRGRSAALPDGAVDQRVREIASAAICTYIYTSGTTGPPKACMLSHANYRANADMIEASLDLGGDSLCNYLFLPLAHALARMLQMVSLDLGGTLAYWERDSQKIIPNLAEVKPTHFISVPRMFEKIYTLVAQSAASEEELREAVEIGWEARSLARAGEQVPDELQARFDTYDRKLYANLRAVFGGNLRQAVTGAAPISPEILKFFWACGVPVYEGYGMTETSAAATITTPDHLRLGTVGVPMPGGEVSVAADGEVLMRGPHIFQGYFKNPEATAEALDGGWLRSGDLGALDRDGFLTITGRKKDLIITSSGKNITPANIENSLKQSRWISQAVVFGDNRPYLVAVVTLDPEEAPVLAAQLGVEPDLEAMAADPEVHGALAAVVDDVNRRYARIEQVKRFAILPRDLTQEGGELTPTMKVKRNVVNDRYAERFAELYSQGS